MATSQDIVTRALTRLSVLRIGGVPSAAQSAHALQSLNSMIDSWTARGVVVDPTLPVPAKHEPGITAMLAVRLSGDYGMTATPELQKEAADGWFSLQSDYIKAPNADIDTALKRLPSQRLEGITFA